MIKRILLAGAVAALPLPALAQAVPDAAALRDAALTGDTVAWDVVEGLTTEVGQRLAGTEAEARARNWAVARLKALGFSNVHIEPFDMPVWVRGAESAEVIAPFPQKLVLAALGNSGATPAAGITAEIVYFPTLADLQAVPYGSLKGKIAFVSHNMQAAQDGSGYGQFGAARRSGPAVAAQKGAAALLIRSIGTDHNRTPHTGVTTTERGQVSIPSAALSVPDAEQLERMVKRGRPVSVHLTLTPRMTGIHQSGNVIADVLGSDPAAGMVVVGGHLDSWDLGTGAIDDGAGVAIMTAAAKRVMDAGQPRRTIRVVWFGAEEVGGFGGEAYYAAHKGDGHALAGESDTGADRVWKYRLNLPASAKPVGERIGAALAVLGIVRSPDVAGSGTDVEPLFKAGVAAVDLAQDASRYFDWHHTPNDTLDKIDTVQLRQNVAAWTVVIDTVANAPEAIGAVTPKP